MSLVMPSGSPPPTSAWHHLHADLLEPLAAKMAEEPFKLLIMDSIAANMRVDYSGREH